MKQKILLLIIFSFFLQISLLTGNDDDYKWISGSSNGPFALFSKLSSNNELFLIASGAYIKIFNTKSNNLVGAIYVKNLETDWIDVEFTRDCKSIVISAASTIQVWDIATAKMTKEIKLLNEGNSFKYDYIIKPSLSDYLVALGNWTGNDYDTLIITTWDINTGELIKSINLNDFVFDYEIKSSVLSPSGNYLYLCYQNMPSDKYTPEIWNVSKGIIHKKLSKKFIQASFSNNDEYFLGIQRADYKRKYEYLLNIYLMDGLDSIKSLYSYKTETFSGIPDKIHFSSDSKTIAYNEYQDTIKVNVYDILTDTVIKSFKPKFVPYFNEMFTFSDTVIGIYEYDDCLAEVFAGKKGEYTNSIAHGWENVDYLTFSPDDKYLGAFYEPGFIAVFETETGKMIAKLYDIMYGNSYNSRIALADNNKYLAFSTDLNGNVYLFDYVNNSIKELKSHKKNIMSLVFSPDTRYLASADMNGQIYLWDGQSFEKADSLSNVQKVYFLYFSDDGKNLYGVSEVYPEGKAVLIKWDIQNKTIERDTIDEVVPYFIGIGTDKFSISADKRYISSSNYVYDLSEKKYYKFETKDKVSANSISPNGEKIAIIYDEFGGSSPIIDIYGWKENMLVKEFNMRDYVAYSDSYKEWQKTFGSIAYSHNNKYIAGGFRDGAIILLKADSLKTGIEEIKYLTSDMNVFPNPFEKSFELEYKNSTASQVSVEIFNTIGDKVFTKELGFLDIGTHKISIEPETKLSQGYYWIVIRNENTVQYRKIIKVN